MNGKIVLVACLFGAVIYTAEIAGDEDSEGGYENTCRISQIDKNEIVSLLKELQLQVQQTCTARCEPSCNQIETQIPTQTRTPNTKRRPSTTARSGLIISDIDGVSTQEPQLYYQIEPQTLIAEPLQSTTAQSQLSDADDVCFGEPPESP